MNRSMAVLLTTLAVLLATSAHAADRTLAERLGYPADAKLLIVHADDLGMAHSVNAATTRAMQTGQVNSASIMVPCPWFPEIAAWAKAHPEADLGIHLTLTSEWTSFRWGPVLAKGSAPSLLDAGGYFYPLETTAAEHIDPREAEAEVRAQIARARAAGINPTHLDAHMRTLHLTTPLFAVLLKVARENGIPAAIPAEFRSSESLAPLIRPDDVVIDRFITIGPEVAPEKWADFYREAITTLPAGVTELIVHIAYDDAEMQAITFDHPSWGSAWRQREYDFLTSPAFGALLRSNNVKLVTWREIAKAVKAR